VLLGPQEARVGIPFFAPGPSWAGGLFFRLARPGILERVDAAAAWPTIAPSQAATLPHFLYRGTEVPARILDPVAGTLSARCPICGWRGRLTPARHGVTLDAVTGEISTASGVVCRQPQCGWAVTIRDGLAVDLTEVLDFGLRASLPTMSRKDQPILWRRRPRRELEAASR
jgi:hypothetical protein